MKRCDESCPIVSISEYVCARKAYLQQRRKHIINEIVVLRATPGFYESSINRVYFFGAELAKCDILIAELDAIHALI